jgi:hypothetical protein
MCETARASGLLEGLEGKVDVDLDTLLERRPLPCAIAFVGRFLSGARQRPLFVVRLGPTARLR